MRQFFLLLAVFSFCNSVLSHGHDIKKGVDIEVTDLGSGIFELRTDRSGNVAVLIGKEGVLMVDTQMEHLVELIDNTQKSLSSNRNVDLIINTHFHRDHVRGNEYLKRRGAIVLAHPNVSRYMENPVALKALGREAPTFTPAFLPTMDIKEGAKIKMNGQNIEIHHTPHAHTNSDLFILFKEANVIHAGDVVSTGRFPFVDIDNGGSVKGLISALKKVISFSDENTKIIAGHGPIATRDDLQTIVTMLNETHGIVKNLVVQGLSLDDIIAQNPLKGYAETWSWGFVNAERMATTHYYDITGKLE